LSVLIRRFMKQKKTAEINIAFMQRLARYSARRRVFLSS